MDVVLLVAKILAPIVLVVILFYFYGRSIRETLARPRMADVLPDLSTECSRARRTEEEEHSGQSEGSRPLSLFAKVSATALVLTTLIGLAVVVLAPPSPVLFLSAQAYVFLTYASLLTWLARRIGEPITPLRVAMVLCWISALLTLIALIQQAWPWGSFQ